LHRRRGVFTPDEAGVLADLARPLGEAIHRALLLGALKLGQGADLPGLILISSDGSVDNVSPTAQRLLRDMLDSTAPYNGLPLVVTSLVADLRSIPTGHADEPRSVRVPGRSGKWYHVCAALLDDRPDGPVSVIRPPTERTWHPAPHRGHARTHRS
jgi:hypothetical protein